MNCELLLDKIDANRTAFETMSDTIWEYAEVCFKEIRSAELQMDYLRKDGFIVTSSIGNKPTAFVAEYGNGKPVIAFCGEYDALPELSQVGGLDQKKPLNEGAPGHGCAHNILGTGCLEAACAVKHWLAESGTPGTVRYYGCPAEEGGCGKVFMIHAGAFDDVDVALSWHPFNRSNVVLSSSAVMGVEYSFRGRASHAATNPSQGRSALDAAEIMNIGTNFLREHLPAGTTIQYAFLNAGAPKPNIIPDSASLLYTIRARSKDNLDDTFDRVNDIAKGAALITGTTAEAPKVNMFYSDILPNDTLHEIIIRNSELCADAGYTKDDLVEAGRFAIANLARPIPMPIDQSPMGHDVMKASADFGDVSRVVPSGYFTLAVHSVGTPLHSWSATAQGKLGYVHKGMHRAAKILALSAANLFEDAALLQNVKAEFARRTEGQVYSNPMFEDLGFTKQ